MFPRVPIFHTWRVSFCLERSSRVGRAQRATHWHSDQRVERRDDINITAGQAAAASGMKTKKLGQRDVVGAPFASVDITVACFRVPVCV